MQSNKHNDVIDTLQKENPHFGLQMYVYISDCIKSKKLDDDIDLDDDLALDLYTAYRNVMKRGRKMALISAAIFLLSITALAIPLFLEINGIGSVVPSWISDLPAVAAIPVGILWMALLLYCFVKTMNALLGWSMVRHIRKYYPHLFENTLEP